METLGSENSECGENSDISAGCGLVLPLGRNRPTPSERNLRVFEAVCRQGKTQTAVAREQGLSQRRVSSICRQVETWLASVQPASRPGAADRAHIRRELLQRQIDRLAADAARKVDDPLETTIVERTTQYQGQTRTETIERRESAAGKWLKLNLRLLELSAKLVRRSPQPEDDDQWLAEIEGDLRQLSAERENLVRSVRQPGA